jgi:hypothetical protein
MGGDAGMGGVGADGGMGGDGGMGADGGAGGSPDVPTPTNLALGKVVTTDSAENGNPAVNGVDGMTNTRWCAANGDDGHWLTVDLGASHSLTGAEIVWEKGTGSDQATAKYKYKIEVSTDNATWTSAVDFSTNTSAEQTQTHAFTGDARYVKVTVLDIVDPDWLWASFWEFRVMGY